MSDLFAGDEDDAPSLFGAGATPKGEPTESEKAPSLPVILKKPPARRVSKTEPAAASAPEPQQAPPKEAPAPEVKEEPKRVPRRVQVAKPKDLVMRSLNHLQRDITQRFDELTEIIESLKPSDQPRGAVLSTDKILREIQSAVIASDEKDRILRQKQLAIESMSYSLAEREERSNLRKQLAMMMEDLAAEVARFADADNDYEFKVKEIERLRGELAQSASKIEQNEARLRNQIEREMSMEKREFESQQKDGNLKIQQMKEEGVQMKEQTDQFVKENQKLALSKPQTSVADLAEFQERVKDKLAQIITELVRSVDEVVQENLDTNESYAGANVCQAMKGALQEGARRVFHPDDD